jgi:peptidoglycan-associated lipoprotein
MKAIRFTTLMALGITLSYVFVGCQPQNLRKIPPSYNTPAEINQMPAITNVPPIAEDTNGIIPMPPYPTHTNRLENADQFKADTIHFAYDSSVVKSGDKPKIAEVADYLKSNPQSAVRVEGNCDERGTEEYNRSLGERRALAAREVIVGLGISPDRVDTISYGEDKPVDPAHNEAAWKQNRRDDFVLLTPPK